MELWIILSFICALALIGFLFWDAKRRFDQRVRSLLRLQQTIREGGATDRPDQQTGRPLGSLVEPSDSPGWNKPSSGSA